MAVKTTSMENTFDSPFRFNNPYDLWTRFNEIVSSETVGGNRKDRDTIVSMYERLQYSRMRGKKTRKEPNWGVFRDAVDDFIKFFSTVALDRKVWCRIETDHGWEQQTDILWSDYITQAFHKFAIMRWEDREQTMLKIIRDDAMFNRGIMVWDDPLKTYPCHVPVEDVYVDTNATTCPDSFDMMFIRRRFSAVELYKKAMDQDSEKLGWSKLGILRALRKSLDSLKSCKKGSEVVDRWRRGGVPELQQDQLIPIIFAYVKEYKEAPEDHDRAGNTISLLVFPEELTALGISPDSDAPAQAQAAQLLKRKHYFQFVDYYAKDFGEATNVWCSNLEHAFYDTHSFAKMILPSADLHDKSNNALIRAIIRNMRLWIRTGSEETRKRLATMDADDEVGHLNQDDEIAQVSMRQDISAASEYMRGIQARIDSFSPNRFQGTQNSPKGYPITKGEAEIVGSQLNDAKTTAIRIAIANNLPFIKQLYKRFINSPEGSPAHKQFIKFRNFLRQRGVPDEAWKEDEVVISARYNKFAGDASSNYATASGLVRATAIKPSSEPERRAKRELIASLTGDANAEDFMDAPMQIDNEMFIIGQENESLDNSFANPSNITVSGTDNHMLHIQGHMMDYTTKLRVVAQLLNTASQDMTYRKRFFLERANDIIMAQDNKGAHIAAHLQIVSRDESKKDEVGALAKQFAQIQSQQDGLQNQIKSIVAQEQQAGEQMSAQDLEFQHKKRMYDLEFQSKQAMLNLDAEKKISQNELSRQAAEAKHSQSIQHKQQDQEMKDAGKKQEIAANVAKSSVEIERKRIEAEIATRKAASKPASNEKPATKKASSSKSGNS